jgi:hypothetical protein
MACESRPETLVPSNQCRPESLVLGALVMCEAGRQTGLEAAEAAGQLEAAVDGGAVLLEAVGLRRLVVALGAGVLHIQVARRHVALQVMRFGGQVGTLRTGESHLIVVLGTENTCKESQCPTATILV